MHAPAASQGGKTRKRSPWDLTMAAGGMVMGVLSEGEGGRGIPGVDSGLWMPFSQPGGERDRERKREKEGSKLGSAQLKRTSRLRLVAVLKKASAASNWVQVSSSIVLFASRTLTGRCARIGSAPA